MIPSRYMIMVMKTCYNLIKRTDVWNIGRDLRGLQERNY